MLCGEQRFRACWLWQAPDGYNYFATDSQLERNRVLRFRAGDADVKEVASIAGSSIYAAQGECYACFSSSVEPGEPSGRTFKDFTERTPGPGIEGRDAVIYVLEKGRVNDVLRARMDGWPLRLAQFATFSFPGGMMPDNRFYAFGRAVKRFDGDCLLFERAA
ncbi:MAG: hypothetical protein IT509_02080 [Rhodocyclaceae bacterium]|nr:hypothetical protein [Rhodocyclaceae bacterium]